jgi:hypothetical protein
MTDDIRKDELQDGELVAAVRRMGDRAADQLDLSRTARGVVARWRAEQVRRRPVWQSPAFLRVAAALVLLVGGIETWEHRQLTRAEVVAVEPTDAGLEGLSADELQALLPAVEQPAAVVESTANDAGLEGLNNYELRSVLTSMGG